MLVSVCPVSVCNDTVLAGGITEMKVLSILTALLLTIPSSSQQASAQTPTSSTQATTLLRQSLAALTGSTALTDVTLTGSARRIAGSNDDTGTAVFKSIAS